MEERFAEAAKFFLLPILALKFFSLLQTIRTLASSINGVISRVLAGTIWTAITAVFNYANGKDCSNPWNAFV
ncbi:hypothetical protein EGR_10654 [Echinococcus granulosus]|uniref:Uncharacterized protein n=1 Tax=Echinococcus granulosus TaxID=6210 RepID=W6U1T1_ECHGR|nr:hypothetical protein EGR_10654 [Echinococcus granulosus]EUB54486.1 hypothetical protein EGR_10654 [Echinococcus granulosus]